MGAIGSVDKGDLTREVYDCSGTAELLDAVEVGGRGGYAEGERAGDGSKVGVVLQKRMVSDELERVRPDDVSVEDADAKRPEPLVCAYDGSEVLRGVELFKDAHPQFVRDRGHGGSTSHNLVWLGCIYFSVARHASEARLNCAPATTAGQTRALVPRASPSPTIRPARRLRTSLSERPRPFQCAALHLESLCHRHRHRHVDCNRLCRGRHGLSRRSQRESSPLRPRRVRTWLTEARRQQSLPHACVRGYHTPCRS